MGISIKFVEILIVPIIFFSLLVQFIKKILIRTERLNRFFKVKGYHAFFRYCFIYSAINVQLVHTFFMFPISQHISSIILFA